VGYLERLAKRVAADREHGRSYHASVDIIADLRELCFAVGIARCPALERRGFAAPRFLLRPFEMRQLPLARYRVRKPSSIGRRKGGEWGNQRSHGHCTVGLESTPTPCISGSTTAALYIVACLLSIQRFEKFDGFRIQGIAGRTGTAPAV